jgi:hercynylcysteine S-oxide lyase
VSPDSAWDWWRAQRPPAELVHLDSAAAGRSSIATLTATAGHAEREAARGAYVAQAEAAEVLNAGRAELAGLLGVPPAGLAFTEGAESALNVLLAAWPLRAGDTVAVVPSEWGPNLDAFTRRGLRLAEIPVDGGGVADLAALEGMLTRDPPALVHLDHVTSHRALIQPAAAAAALCQAAGVPLWVDAAQALGHVDAACGADAIYATGRKWLTGPRGVGLLGVTEPWWDRLAISASELATRELPVDASPVWLVMAREANVAAWAGMCTAVREFTAAGPARVWDRLAAVGGQTRQALADLPGWAVAGPAGAGSAITALRPANGQDVATVRARLLGEHGIVTTAAGVTRAPRDMTEPLLRISPHVDCTPQDLARLRNALLTLGASAG